MRGKFGPAPAECKREAAYSLGRPVTALVLSLHLFGSAAAGFFVAAVILHIIGMPTAISFGIHWATSSPAPAPEAPHAPAPAPMPIPPPSQRPTPEPAPSTLPPPPPPSGAIFRF